MRQRILTIIVNNTDDLIMAKKPTKAESEHMGKVAAMGCIVCCNLSFGETPATIHHIGNGTMAKRASNYEVIPLCHFHHQGGNNGEAVHSGRKSFEKNFGTEKELLSQTLRWLNL